MDQEQVYQAFIEWLGKAPMTFPPTENMIALIKARYTPEDAELLTNVPYDPRTIGEIAEIKQMSVDDLKPRLDALARKGVVWKIFQYGAYRYQLCDPFLVFYRSVYWGGGRNSEHYVMAPLLNPMHQIITDDREKKSLEKLVDGLSRRDFTYLFFPLALFGWLGEFLWVAAIGTWIYAATTLSLRLKTK